MSGGPALRGVLFDLDGTLYRQPPLRLRMALELGLESLRRPFAMRRALRALAVFRRVREELREAPAGEPLARRQYDVAAERAGVPAPELEALVDEWILRRPLRHLRRVRVDGLPDFLAALASRGLRVGVFSDYPVDAKLDALGVAEHFELRLCATDPEVDAFKPDPRGYLRACEIWGLAPGEVLYVGDREEVDAAGAGRAGMACALLDPSPTLRRRGEPVGAHPRAIAVASLAELQDAIDRRG